MKVLWVSNTIFPDLAHELGLDLPVVGGWMYGLANDLVRNNIELVVVTTRPQTKSYHTNINGIEYFLLKAKKNSLYYDVSLEKEWKRVISLTNPDLVHIYGVEYAHGLSLLGACPNEKYVVSIQGLISACSKYYESGISSKEIKKNITFRDIFRSDNILQAKKKFKKRSELTEKKYFELVKNFVGRTSWDYAHTKAYSSESNYFFCNESLRDSFYSSRKWSPDHKKDHSIFLSQAGYPLKGFHQVVKALAILKDEFPSARIRIAGNNILQTKTLRDKLRLTGYGKYLISLLKENGLLSNIEFLGFLDEKKMIEEYLDCHVFICPSSIENSPNSLGEAQLLGVPCIASYVGGVPDMIQDGQTGLLYRFEEVEMLAQAIKRVFIDSNLAMNLSKKSIVAASRRHDREANLKQTLSIYKNITTKHKEL